MIGRKLANRLISNAQINNEAVTSLILADVAPPADGVGATSNISVETVVADLTSAESAQQLVQQKPDIIYHLAAIVSGEAEMDMSKGYRVNMDGTRYLLEAIRTLHEQDGYTPKLIFTSSIAVYGAPFPDPINDEYYLTPMTSYGTQKAICELLLSDYHRRAIVQGIALRLPTICIRPGKPNKAASGFFSGIIREPINGEQANLPVEDTVRHWFASPRTAVDFLLHAATLSTAQIGSRCNLSLPGLCASVAEQIESLERVVGSSASKLITRNPDPAIRAIVDNWPQSFSATRAIELGFEAERTFDELIQVYLEDDYKAS